MPNSKPLFALAALQVLVACASQPQPPVAEAPGTSGPLFEKISALDSEVFAAFNSCAAPDNLEKHAAYFADDVEFYHDQGGVTWNRRDMLANTQKNVCGNFRRELVAGTLRVYPIKDFGAIAQGVHRFCQFKTGTCAGAADFVIVWREVGRDWRITRVLSYGHRGN